MISIIKSITGLSPMTDQVIATDFLINSKSAIRNYAIAITETHNPQLREILKLQLEDAIKTHEKITNYMIKNNFYYTHDINSQFDLDLKITETALKLTKNE